MQSNKYVLKLCQIVPLMEPDIGSNFKVDFAPRFIINILDSSIRTSNHEHFDDINIRSDVHFEDLHDLNAMYVDSSCSNNGIIHSDGRDLECNDLPLSPGGVQDQMIYDDMALEVQQALLHPPITGTHDSNSNDDHDAGIAANSSA